MIMDSDWLSLVRIVVVVIDNGWWLEFAEDVCRRVQSDRYNGVDFVVSCWCSRFSLVRLLAGCDYLMSRRYE